MPNHAQRHTLSLLGGDNAPHCENRALRFSKFTDPALKDEGRRKFFDAALSQKISIAVLKARIQAYDEFLDRIDGVIRVYAKNESRLLLNMSSGVLENAGLSLERLTGLPFIPGSAVKGSVRHAAICELHDAAADQKAELLADIALIFGWGQDDWKNDLKKSDFSFACGDEFPVAKNEAQRLIGDSFGKFPKEFAGSIAFFDALPYEPQANDLEIDIVTSHHMEYYQGNIPVALDNEDPNPVVFPAVASGQIFGFALAPVPGCRDMELKNKAENWLRTALEHYGIGAKTAAGYGWFSLCPEISDEKRKAEEKRRDNERIAEQALIEKKRHDDELAALPPIERYKTELTELATKNNEAFVDRVKTIEERPDDEQRALIHLFRENNVLRDRLKTWRKKKNPNAGLLEKAAQKLGEKLP